ncbi:UNVERIFIED_CONTAM: hypothetical protein NCL1_27577 [Trichonephila clavipes]
MVKFVLAHDLTQVNMAETMRLKEHILFSRLHISLDKQLGIQENHLKDSSYKLSLQTSNKKTNKFTKKISNTHHVYTSYSAGTFTAPDVYTTRPPKGRIFVLCCCFKIHWCAKIKDEVEKLAYQLNEEAERTERPIRRLISVAYITHVLTYWGSYEKSWGRNSKGYLSTKEKHLTFSYYSIVIIHY